MKYYLAFIVLLTLAGCNTNVGEKIGQAGEKAGKAAGEVAKGISQGVEKVFELRITRADSNTLKEIEIGKISVGNHKGTDDKLTVYFIFKEDFSGNIMLRAYDAGGLEMGRSTVLVKGKKNGAGFTDFIFDKRTNIDSDSKIIMDEAPR